MASDDNYSPFIATTITSIMENTSSNIYCYILDGGISENNKKKIQNISKKYENLNIEFIDIDLNKYFNNFPDSHHYTLNTYSRLLIPYLKPELKNIPVIANVDFGHTYPILTIPLGGTAIIENGNITISA